MTFLEGAFPGRARNHKDKLETDAGSCRARGSTVNLVTQMISMLVAAVMSFSAVSRSATVVSSAAPIIASSSAAPMAVAEMPAPPLDLFGLSGALRATIGLSDVLAADASLEPLLSGLPIDQPGIHVLPVTAPDGDSLAVISLLPYADRAAAAAYHVGSWPSDRLAATDARYAHPAGFITVTPENEFTRVSKHFRLADFLTHDQSNVWPKLLVLRPKLIDKLELVSQELAREGLPDRLHIMSGFRTPQYNALGVGPGKGRARDSRHMYGDAADVFVDADGDGRMDDLDHDGRVTKSDARVLFAAAERVEQQHPELIGGLSAYSATPAHGPFVHVDVRGTRARW